MRDRVGRNSVNYYTFFIGSYPRSGYCNRSVALSVSDLFGVIQFERRISLTWITPCRQTIRRKAIRVRKSLTNKHATQYSIQRWLFLWRRSSVRARIDSAATFLNLFAYHLWKLPVCNSGVQKSSFRLEMREKKNLLWSNLLTCRTVSVYVYLVRFRGPHVTCYVYAYNFNSSCSEEESAVDSVQYLTVFHSLALQSNVTLSFGTAHEFTVL